MLFIPPVWIYYNESAMIHAVWYLATASIGLSFGVIIRGVVDKNDQTNVELLHLR